MVRKCELKEVGFQKKSEHWWSWTCSVFIWCSYIPNEASQWDMNERLQIKLVSNCVQIAFKKWGILKKTVFMSLAAKNGHSKFGLNIFALEFHRCKTGTLIIHFQRDNKDKFRNSHEAISWCDKRTKEIPRKRK